MADAPLSMPLGPCLCLPLRALPLQTVANLQHMHKGRTVNGEGCGRGGGGQDRQYDSLARHLVKFKFSSLWGRQRQRAGETLSLDGHVCLSLILPFPHGKGRVSVCVCAQCGANGSRNGLICFKLFSGICAGQTKAKKTTTTTTTLIRTRGQS